jgi:hypothetical protein
MPRSVALSLVLAQFNDLPRSIGIKPSEMDRENVRFRKWSFLTGRVNNRQTTGIGESKIQTLADRRK